MQFTDQERDELALGLLQRLRQKPGLTVQELAQAMKVPEGEIRRVLDEYLVTDTGVKQVGPGGGGGWVDA